MMTDCQEEDAGAGKLTQPEITELAERLMPKVKFCAARIYGCGRRQVPQEDLEQEGMVALLRSLARFEPAKGVKPWTFVQYAVEGAMKELGRRKNRTWYTCRTSFEDPGVSLDFAAAGPDAYLTTLASQLLDSLEPSERHILKRRYWDGIPVSAIAREMELHRTRVPQLETGALTFLADQLGTVYTARRRCSHSRDSA